MKRLLSIFLSLALSWLFLIGYCQTATDSIKPQISKTYAVVIGISQYQSKSLPQLRFADKDAALFGKFLQSKSGGSVPAEQMKILLNEGATIAAVYDALDWLKEICKDGDLAYVYFSGHGDVETKNTFSLGYLLAYNTPATNYTNNAIRIEDISNLANTLSTKNKAKVVLITDACHTGKLAGDYYKGKQLVASQLRLVLNNEVRLASCGVDEEAAEGMDWGGGRGAFSYYLLMGLNGFAKPDSDGSIRLKALDKFLDSCFSTDKILLSGNQKQRPVTDGNPMFPMSVVTTNSITATLAADTATSSLSVGLQAFKPLGIQPVDYFFTKVKNGGLDSMNDVFPNGRLDIWNKKKYRAIENVVDFNKYNRIEKDSFALAVVNDCIQYEDQHAAFGDSLGNGLFSAIDNSYDTLVLLAEQLKKNKSLNNRFIEKFVQMVHEKGQDMVNAYLGGDLAELEKRQYYFAGNRQYEDFIAMLNATVKIVPVTHNLFRLLKLHQSYLSGLVARLQMATSKNRNKLLKEAFLHQWQALKLEPYAAYVHNELGNLQILQKRYDSAAYHFNLASVLSPTWAIPWSNRIRLNLALNNNAKAKEAILKADSLQPKLAYVMMNAGLVMEKEKNWLAAEAFYLKAIEENKIHFLPYERLAKIYLLTGEYAKADTLLFETKTRKNDFALNDEDFRFGVSLGGPDRTPWFGDEPVCVMDSFSEKNNWLPYVQFLQALALPDSSQSGLTLAVSMIQQALQQRPALPMAHHYLGKKLYKLERWQEAATAIESEVKNNHTEEFITGELKSFVSAGSAGNDTAGMSKLLESFLCRRYFYLEDFYLLGSIYEKLGRFKDVVSQYEKITAEENQRLADHAVYDGFYNKQKAGGIKPGAPGPDEREYNSPVKMAGYIKLSRLYESVGDYEKAEQILLHQVALNQAAGFARRDVNLIKNGKNDPNNASTFNYYWLSVNRNVESETYNFYKRITEHFPRDGEWNKRTGMFLYKRLAMSFNKVPVEQFTGFYKTITHFEYPFQPGEFPAEDMQPVTIMLPGTGEQLVIDMPVYDAVKQSLEMLQRSVKLSGEVLPEPQVQQAIAALNSWMGNREAALKNYFEAIAAQPENTTLRNKLINYLVAYNELPAAVSQLEVLQRQHALTRRQLLQLATYQALSNRKAAAVKTLNQFNAITNEEQNSLISVHAKMEWLQNQPLKAVEYLEKLTTEVDTIASGNDSGAALQQEYTNFRLYSIARLYALMKKDKDAMAALKKALDNGFDYQFVLDYDEAWTSLRKSKQWQKLLTQFSFERQYNVGALTKEVDPVWYRIPD